MAGDAGLAREYGTLARVEELIAALDAAPDAPAAGAARELLQLVLDAHSGAFARLLDLVRQARDADGLLERIADDDQVRSIMLLHGLHPDDAATRVQRALDGLRPALGTQGIVVSLIDCSEHAVRLALSWDGTRGPLPPAAVLQRQIEEAIFEAVPDVAAIAVQGLPLGMRPVGDFFRTGHAA